MDDRRQRFRTGVEAEDRAADYLTKLGFTELDRRARMKGGELDLVMVDASSLVFVEVKARKTIAKGAEAVSARQQARIRTGLRAWLSVHDTQGRLMAAKTVRCDVVLVAPDEEPVHIPNAFPAADDLSGI